MNVVVLTEKIAEADAGLTDGGERMEGAVAALKRTQRRLTAVPQGYTEVEELVAIRRLLRLDRIDEARLRFDTLLDRHHPGWRTLA